MVVPTLSSSNSKWPAQLVQMHLMSIADGLR
jgi:hypothetical protein